MHSKSVSPPQPYVPLFLISLPALADDDICDRGDYEEFDWTGHSGYYPLPYPYAGSSDRQKEIAKKEINKTEITQLSSLTDLVSLPSLVSATRETRNARCPVNRLPVETLTGIFEFLSRNELERRPTFPFDRTAHGDGPQAHNNMGDVMAAYQVCRYWRKSLQGFPSIWTTIIISPSLIHERQWDERLSTMSRDDWEVASRALPRGAQLVNHYLSLSGSLPLDVYLHKPGLLPLFARQSHRLRRLEVSFYPGHGAYDRDLHFIPGSWTMSAPLLEVLDVMAVQPATQSWFNSESRCQLSIPSPGDFPLLRKLRLSGFSGWRGTPIHNLTHICITGYSEINGTGLIDSTPRELLQLLEHSPAVEELYISHVGAWFALTEAAYKDTPEIHLLHLRRLSISDSHVPELNMLFAYLHVPRGASLSLTNIGSDHLALTHTLSRHASRLDNIADLKSLEINHSAGKIMAFGPSGSLRIISQALDTIFAPEDLHLTPFAETLEVVWISGGDWQDLEWRSSEFDWIAVFTALVSLRTLHVHFKPAQSIVQVVTPPSPTTSPCLHTLPLTSSLALNDEWPELEECASLCNDSGQHIRRIQVELGPSVDRDESKKPWLQDNLDRLGRHVSVVERDVVCSLIEVPAELNEGTHPQYWPVWVTGYDHA